MKRLHLLILISIIVVMGKVFGQEIQNINQIGPITEQIKVELYKQILYVSQRKGSDKDGDGSLIKPWATIEKVFSKINDLSKENLTTIFVAEGTYAGTTLIMKQYVDIFGGFNTETWQRDIYKYPSILDGEHMRRVVIGADNSRIDGFTIRNGLARSNGGGILCDDSSPTISNCFITNNYVLEPENFNYKRIHQNGNHGGGIACLYNAVPVIRNNVFYGNKTSIGNGGAISFYGWVRNDAAPQTRIENNIMVGGWQPSVKNNVFIHNISGFNDIGRTRSSNGGAISCSGESRPVIENNIIACNQAKGRSDAGGIYTENYSYPLIVGNWIVGNISDDDGGGIYTNHMGHAVISKNYIAGNWTIGNGAGGIRLSKESRATINDNIIVQNQTGGGVQSVDSHMELTRNIIMHNKGNVSFRYSNVFSYFAPSIIEDNIILENEGGIDIQLMKEEKITFINNNINEKKIDKANKYRPIKLADNEVQGEINKYSIEGFQTIIELKSKLEHSSLLGKVIRIGDFWSVIQKVENNKLFVWGDVRLRAPNETSFFILSNYELIK